MLKICLFWCFRACPYFFFFIILKVVATDGNQGPILGFQFLRMAASAFIHQPIYVQKLGNRHVRNSEHLSSLMGKIIVADFVWHWFTVNWLNGWIYYYFLCFGFCWPKVAHKILSVIICMGVIADSSTYLSGSVKSIQTRSSSQLKLPTQKCFIEFISGNLDTHKFIVFMNGSIAGERKERTWLSGIHNVFQGLFVQNSLLLLNWHWQ